MTKMTRRFHGLLACVLLASTGAGAQVTTYCCDATAEQQYLADVALLGGTVSESFENAPWTSVRAPFSLPSISSQGLTWSRTGGGVTTSDGNSWDGFYQVYGVGPDGFTHANPDGFDLSGDGTSLRAVGGWYTGNGTKIAFTVDGDPNRVNFTGTEATVFDFKFLGFIDTATFSTVAIRAVDEGGTEQRIFFADAFTVATTGGTPSPGSLQFSSAVATVAEDGIEVLLTVTRTGGSDGAVTIDYATADGSATAGTDYTAASGTLAFADGETSKTIAVGILDDAVFEGDESFTVSLANATGGATAGTPTTTTVTITDNDPTPPAGSLQFAAASYSVAENGGSLLVSVTRSGGTFGAVSVDYATVDGSAMAGTDYAVASGTLSFADGEVSRSFTVTILDDTSYEGDESFSINLSTPGGGATLGTPATAAVTITENDPTPPAGSLQLTAASYSVAENGGSLHVSVSRTGGSFGAVSVNYATSDGSATAGTDYAAASGTLAFADGETSGSFTVTIIDDTDYEGDEDFVISLSAPGGGASLGIPASAVVTISENDPTPPAGSLQLSGATYTIAENGASLLVTVVRTGGSFGTVGIDYATADGSAVAGSDYTATNGTLSFADGVTSQGFTIPILDDAIYEGDEHFVVHLSAPTGGAALGTPASATINIAENDPTPPAGSLQLSGAAYAVAENGASILVTVTRTGGSFGAVGVDYQTADGTATAGADYSAAAGTLAFADGEVSRSFTVAILDDTDYEGDESFSVSLSAPTGGATLGTPATATVTITEDDPVPPAGSLQFSGAAYSVAEDGVSVLVTVTRTGGSFGAVSADYATADGSAAAGADYTATSGTLSFADGELSRAITIPILDDAVFEGNETFSIGLSAPTGGATLGSPAAATVTITENDPVPPAGSLQFSGASYTVGEDGVSLLVTVTRTGGSFGTVGVSYASADASATAGSDYTAVAGTLSFADGVMSQGFTIAILDDTTYEGDETFSVDLSAPTGGASLGTPASATVTIAENDPLPPSGSLQFEVAAVAVAENAATVSVDVVRSGGSFGTLSANWQTSNGSAAAGSDYVAASGVVTFADGVTRQTITVTLLDDSSYEGDETFSIGLSGAAVGAPAHTTVTITENDPVPPAGNLQFGNATYAVGENGGSVLLTVTRTGGSFGAVGVSFATADGSALAGSDYTMTSGTLSFADGETSRSISIAITDDSVYEGDETFAVNLSAATGGAAIGAPATATVTINEDDPTPPAGALELQQAAYSMAEDGTGVNVTVVRTGGSFGEVSVDYATTDGSAIATADYTAMSGTLVFPDGVTAQNLLLTPVDDSQYEGDEDFTINLSNPMGGATLGATSGAVVTIVDDDPAPPAGSLQFDAAAYGVSENGATVQLTVTRTGGSFGIVSVDYATGDATATAASDYDVASGTLVFADGELSRSFNVTILDDTDYEGNETFNVALAGVTGGATIGAPSVAVVTIHEDDPVPPAGSVAFSGSQYAASENAGSISITVDRTGGSFGAVSVDYRTDDGTAMAGADFTATTGTLDFADGEVSRSFSVPLVDDTAYEGSEAFTVVLSNPAGGVTLGQPATATVAISDDDPVPPAGSLQLGGATYAIGEEEPSLLVTVTRSGGSFGTVSVDYATSDGTATAAADYTATSGTLTLADGVVSASFSVPIVDDSVYEGDETFGISLSGATGGASLGMPSTATVTIVEDDVPPPAGSLQFAGDRYTVVEGSRSVTLTVSRSGGDFGEVTIDYATVDGSARRGADYREASGTLVFASGELSRSFDIEINNDTAHESDEEMTVELGNPSGGATLGTPAIATVMIHDDDPAPPRGRGRGTGAFGLPALLVLLLCVLVSPSGFAGSAQHEGHGAAAPAAADPHAAHRKAAAARHVVRRTAHYSLDGLQAVDMLGHDQSLGALLDERRPVLLNFIFTTCTTICPVQSATFAQVQRRLGGDAGKVRMISVSIDPEYDTPRRLRDYANLFGAGEQWSFLTGTTEQMIDIQVALDAYQGNKMSHLPLVLIKPAGSDEWIRLEGLASADRILDEYASLAGSS